MTELRTTNSIRSELGIVLLLAVSVAVVYWQVVNHQFVRYDDDKYITDNSYVQQGFTSESVVWAFTTGHASNWHPLTWLSHMADYELFGLHPAGHLLMNVFLHLLNSIVLFLLLRSMTGALWQSAFVAALFALHPLHVESVAWAAERKDTLSALFWFVATWAYLHYARKPTIARITGVAVLLGLGLMAKPMLVTLPFTFLLLDFWPLDRLGILGTDARPKWSEIKPNVGNLLWEKLPLFTLVAISSNITYTVQQRGGAMSGEDSIAFTVRVANALVSYVEYVRMMVWPSGLAVFYPHFGETIPSWQVVGGAVLLCGITAVALRYGRQRPYLSVGWFWYVGTLLPVIGFVQVGAQAMADRYTYIPLVGLFIIVAWGAADVSTRWRKRGSILAFSSACVLVALMVVAWQQVGYWKNGVALFERAVSVTERNWLAHHNLAVMLEYEDRLEAAASHFRKTLDIYPHLSVTHVSLARVLEKTGNVEEAIHHYVEAIRSKPDDLDAHAGLGMIFLRKERFADAIEHFEIILQFRPDDEEIQHRLELAKQRLASHR